MAKKKQNWYLIGALGAVGLFIYSRKKKEEDKAKVTAIIKGAAAAEAEEEQKAQGEYVGIGYY